MANHTDHRPLSPHLTIYRPQITTILSISHRITGVALYGGSALLVAWLWGAAYNLRFYHTVYAFMGTWFGRILMVGWTFAFFYHLANGMRHLNWDIGRGFALKNVSLTGWLAVSFAAVMTALTWCYALGMLR